MQALRQQGYLSFFLTGAENDVFGCGLDRTIPDANEVVKVFGREPLRKVVDAAKRVHGPNLNLATPDLFAYKSAPDGVVTESEFIEIKLLKDTLRDPQLAVLALIQEILKVRVSVVRYEQHEPTQGFPQPEPQAPRWTRTYPWPIPQYLRTEGLI